MFTRYDFGDEFKWGVANSAFQNEGAAREGGKGASIWDTFTSNPRNVKDNSEPGNACDFYNRYDEDIELAYSLGFTVFRFSISWPRVIPLGVGDTNPEGIEFYNRVINKTIARGMEPWVTLYHWDLPQAIEDVGGWTNRRVIEWFASYAMVCAKAFGDRVKYWIVMNEPMSFTGLGYFLGYHAPGRKGIRSFLQAAHHVTLSIAEGGRVIRDNVPGSRVGVALSCSHVKPLNKLWLNVRAARRVEGILNRFFIEPLLGMGYPTDVMPALNIIKLWFKPGDAEKLAFDFDFIGLQYYFRVVTKFSLNPLVLFAAEIPAFRRPVTVNEMGMEVYPKGVYRVLKFFSKYNQIREIVITESGVCYPDNLNGGKIHDEERRKYHQAVLKQILKAKKRGINVSGYLVWTLVDNFEWSDGYLPKFGIARINPLTQKLEVKQSGEWFKHILNGL